MFPCCQEVVGASLDPALVLFHFSHPICSVGPCTQRSCTAFPLLEFVPFTFWVLWLCLYHQPLLCSLVKILPAAVLPQKQSLPVPRSCTPGVLFPSLSEACKQKRKACYFTMIPPSLGRGLLLSCAVSSWGTSCSAGSKFQDRIKIFRGCNWFPADWHTAGKTGFKHAFCLDVTSHLHGAVSLKLCDLMTALGILWKFLAWMLCWFQAWGTGRLSWIITEAAEV